MPIQFINGVECVECPCCKGRGYLTVWDEDKPIVGTASDHICTHCMGKRFVAVELEAKNEPVIRGGFPFGGQSL